MVYANIPWTQVVLATCAFATVVIVLVKMIWNAATFQKDLRKDVDLILTNHLPHILAEQKETNKRLEQIETWLYSQDQETNPQKPN